MKKLNYLSRSQLQVLHDLGGARNASRIMKQMEQYVNCFRDGENIYYLSNEGRQRVGAKKVCKKTIQARHYLMRNSIYIAYGQPSTWKNEIRLKVPEEEVNVICDALFQRDKRYHIVEVDHTQKMTKNRIKIEKYRRLIELGVFKGTIPKFIWITTTEYRRKQIAKLCDGLDVQIFTVSDFQ